MTHELNRTANRARCWAAGLAAFATALLSYPTSALGQTGSDPDSEYAAPPFEGFYLRRNPGISLGLEPYAGIAVLAGGDGSRGHGIAGGVSRLRLGYLELGASLEASDSALVWWRQVGGFVGAYLPMAHWVDFDTSLGLAQRNYVSSDTRYGPGGFDVRGPALTYRIGVSDRPVGDRFGLRLGAAMLFGIDLKRYEGQWSLESRAGTVTGVMHVGGVSVGLVACVGFDVILRRSSER
jgi:hypothetical protein